MFSSVQQCLHKHYSTSFFLIMYNHAHSAPQTLKGISLFVFIVNNCVFAICYKTQEEDMSLQQNPTNFAAMFIVM